MTEPQTPMTEAGRAFHWRLHAPLRGCVLPCDYLQAILAIEAEAAAAEPGLDAKKVAALVEAALRLSKVMDLSSSVHTPERRAARLAFRAALAGLTNPVP